MSNTKIPAVKPSIRVQELDETVSSTLRIYDADEKAAKDPFLSVFVPRLREYSVNMNSSILQSKVLSNLAEKDDARDSAFSSFCSAVTSYAGLPVAALSEKAVPVKEICDKYKKANLAGVSFVEESSQLKSFFTDLEAVSENIKALEGVGEKLDELKAAQTDFASSYDAYIKNLNGKAPAASTLKKPILEAMNKELIPYLNAMLVAKNADVADFAAAVKTLIEKINSQVKQHAK